jgi:hypothetical protein
MYKIVDWTPELDLREFYSEANRRGFANNASQKAMVDCFNNEPEKKVWILYQDDSAIGSVAAHTFDIMGPNAYRVLARTCTFGTARPMQGLITPKRLIAEHQNLTDQFLLPTCIKWAKGDLYATSNASNVGSQRLVHRHYFPTLAELGIVKRIKTVYYRGVDQTVWQIYPDKFLANLECYPRWI